ncbi:MAG: substrate-binding domain-containing protein [Eubacterium sp.]|nr:substrate-binding domain-containing protein [Eubacterium sp.]
MKKKLLGIILAAAMVCGLAACGAQEPAPTPGSSAGTEQAGGSESLIGICVPGADHGWTAGIAFYAQEKANELGWVEGEDYKLLTSENVNDQANDIEELIALGCTSIVLLPHNDEVSVAAQKIYDAGINLVVFDRKVNGDYTAYLAGDNPGIGTNGAKYIGDALGGEGVVAVMTAPSLGSVSVERTEAFKAEMAASYPNIKLVDVTAEAFTQEAGLTMATDMLTANEHIDAVFSIDDEPSLGVLQAIKEAGRTDIQYISGGGGAQAWYAKIQEEDINCFTATYSPAMIGDAIELAVTIESGADYEKEVIMDAEIVDKNNVAEKLNANSPY